MFLKKIKRKSSGPMQTVFGAEQGRDSGKKDFRIFLEIYPAHLI